MTFLEFLLKNNIEEATAKKIVAAMKENNFFLSSEENIDTRYSKLKEQHSLKEKEHTEATKLIAELQKSLEGNQEAATKITEYESKLEKLESEKRALELDSAVKFKLLANGAKAEDLDYLMFKVKQNEISVDEKGNLKGLDVKEVQTAFPNHFTKTAKKKFESNKLPDSDQGEAAITREKFKKMDYNARAALKSENPELYAELRKE